MARTTRSTPSPHERARWLEEFEQGVGTTELARKSGRDIRTVLSHLEIAREERVWAQARAEFLRSRLESHQEDLLRQADALKQAFLGRSVTAGLEYWSTRETRMAQAFLEHIRQLRLKKLLDTYSERFDLYTRHRDEVQQQLLEKEHKVLDQYLKGVQVHPWADPMLNYMAAATWTGSSWIAEFWDQEEAYDSQKRYRVRYGNLEFTPVPVDETSRIKVRQAYELLISFAAERWDTLEGEVVELKELSREIVYQLDTYLLKRLLPGRCDLCPDSKPR